MSHVRFGSNQTYVRFGSNPEDLFIYVTRTGRLQISVGHHPDLEIPIHVFHGLLKRWGECYEDSSYRGAKIREMVIDGRLKYVLSYKNWQDTVIGLYGVTLSALYHENKFRWEKKKNDLAY